MNFIYLFFYIYLFIFYQSTMCSRCTVDGHQMYLGGSVLDKASTIDIWPSPPLIFTGGQNVQILA